MATAGPDSPGLQERFASVTDEIVRIPVDYPIRRNWWIFFGVALSLLGLFFLSVGVLFWYGPGVWGNDIPVNWGLAISNYVWWIGIGHAGTLISAMLLLLRENWRNSLNRFAEAMTLFAVICGGLYPILHLGRPWYFYWMAPYPNTMDVWPQFRSPLTWDFFAVLTYLLVSLGFWYIGAVPDFAAARDRTKKRRWQVFFGLIALGWRGSARHWARWRQSYRLTAAIAVPLVVSVHSEISLLFAAGPIPGWHATLFPPYFVLGAAFSGFAVVAMLAIPLRHAFGLHHLVTARHLDLLGILLLATGLMTAYGYVAELFFIPYSGAKHELQTLADRLTGEYAWSYWGAVVLNFVPLQLLWFRRVRRNPVLLFLICLAVAIGMWLERYMLLVTSLYRDYLVSSWGHYEASFWEWSLFAGTIGLFLVPFLLFIRLLPMISSFELKESIFEESETEEKEEDEVPTPPAEFARPREALESDGEDALYGLLAEFDRPERLMKAAEKTRAAGFRKIDAFTPFPVSGLAEKLGATDNLVPMLTLIGGILGAAAGFGLQVYVNLDYPLNVGGRPLIAVPAFMMITFELMVLFAVAFSIGGMLVLNRLPRLHHPLFNVDRFQLATADRFFLFIAREDPRFGPGSTRRFLEELRPRRVIEIPREEPRE